MNNKTLNLFILDKEIYSVDENAVKNISHQFKDEQTLRKYLETFIHLIGSDMAPIQKKTDLSNLMDKLIDWKKLIDRLRSGVVNIL